MSTHNFADGNTLSSFAKSVKLLLEILWLNPKDAFKWFFIYTDKLRFITIQKSNQRIKPKQFLIESDVVEIASLVKSLRIHIDDQLNFNLIIGNRCKTATKQLNTLVRFKYFLGFEEREI